MNETPAGISIETLFYFVKQSLCITESCNLFYINKSVIPMRILPRFFIYANELLNYSIFHKKIITNMQSIDSLRELNAKLLVEITELKKRFPNLERSY